MTNHNDVFVFACDIGTSSMKTCLYNISNTVELIDAETAWYSLNILSNGRAEQNPMDWFNGLQNTIQVLLQRNQISIEKILGISFCSQMQGVVLVDDNCQPLRPAMSYMDQRAHAEFKEGMAFGIKVSNLNIRTAFVSLKETGVVAASVKDPVWKYKWVEKNEPKVFKKVHKWLDVKDFLVSKLTNNFVMSEDSAFATLLYNSRKKKWSRAVCKLLKVNMNHLPNVIASTDSAGCLTATMSKKLGLSEKTIVFAGGGDASLIGVGAGAIDLHDTHIYSGTSGWLSTVVNKRLLDANAMIASIVGAQPNLYNYFAELETAGKCVEWVKDHLAADEALLKQKKQSEKNLEVSFTNLYEYMSEQINKIPAGSGGVIFTPWLHGNRSPFEDANARGIFFNLSLDTGKTEMIRAVVEGIAFHMRWFLAEQEKKTKTSNAIRFVGGGALSEVSCQIMADVLNRKIETVADPQNVGAMGAAILMGIGLGKIDNFAQAKNWIKVQKTYTPNREVKAVYDKNFSVFVKLYKSNKKHFATLNSVG